MRLDDLDEIGRVERECFTTPWPLSAYRRELRDNKMSRYVVLTSSDPVDEAAESAPAASAGRGDEGGDLTTSLRRALEQILRPFGIGTPAETAGPRERIVGFAGLWLMLDEAHVTTICVARCFRGKGLGEVLMSHLMDLSN